MSERSRGPEGSSRPAPTDRGNVAASDDFYAAAAASVAARNGSNGRSGTNGSAPAPVQDRDKLTPQARPAQRPGQPVPNQPVARSGGNPPAPKPSDNGSDDEPTTGISGIASSVLNAVRPKPKADKPEKTEKIADRSAASAPAAEPVRSPVLPSTPPPSAPVATTSPVTVTAVKDKPKAGAARGTRKARLRLSRLDPWSVMKTSFMFSIAAGIVFVVAVFAVWTVIGSSGLFSSIDSIVGSVLQSPGDTTPFRVEDYVNTQKVMGVTAFLACIDVVIFTALATLASFLYNLAATMLGGLEVTLAED